MTDMDSVEGATHTLMNNLKRICDGVPEVEVVRAKTQLKANMLMQLDSFAHTCEDIGEL